jgi:formate/nitrite transporter FocA (FNT family)
MASALAPPAADTEQSAKKAPQAILQSEINEGLGALERSVGSLFVSGLSGGLDLGFSVLLMAVMWTHAHGQLATPIVEILIANMYAIGFIFVVIGRSELFTEQTTLAVLPVLSGQTSMTALLRLWGIVYVANLIGAVAFARLVTIVGPELGVVDVRAFGFIAGHVLDHSAHVIFLSAVLADWLMGLLSWLVAAGRDTISQIVLVWLVTTCIGFAGLHHVILGSVEVFAGVFAHQGIGGGDVVRFLICATLGNAVGGSVFVAVLKYGHAKPEEIAERVKPYRISTRRKDRKS